MMMWPALALAFVSLSAGPVSFTGSAGVYGEYGWVSGDPLVEPRPELRFVVNPTLSLWNFPIGMNILLSTQESHVRQQLDKFKLFLDPKKWLESQTDLSGLALSIKGFELGSCNPSWTPYTLAGAPVLGGAFELNPWYLYAAGAVGRNQRRVPVSDTTQGAYARMLYSARFGFGKKEGTHFYLTGAFLADDTTSLANNRLPNPNDTVPPPDSFEFIRPQENYVLGAVFNLDLYEGAVRLESEFAGCEVTRDRRMPVEEWDWMPDWITRTFKPRMSSSVDYAFKLRPVFRVLDTRLYGRLEYVGPGYKSLAAPGLRNDNYALGAGIERDFFDRAVSVGAAVSAENDNLMSVAVRDTARRVIRVMKLKSHTSRFVNWEARLGLSFPNLPYLYAGYYPYLQASDSLDSLARVAGTSETRGKVVSVSTGHSFQTGGLSHSPSLSVGYNDLRGYDAEMDYTSWDFGLNHAVGFSSPLSVSAGAGYSRAVFGSDEPPDARVYFDISPSYTFFEKWHNSLSVGTTFGSGTRLDLRYSSSFPVWKICDGRVGVSNAGYSGDDGKYNDLRLTAGLSRNW